MPTVPGSDAAVSETRTRQGEPVRARIKEGTMSTPRRLATTLLAIGAFSMLAMSCSSDDDGAAVCALHHRREALAEVLDDCVGQVDVHQATNVVLTEDVRVHARARSRARASSTACLN